MLLVVISCVIACPVTSAAQLQNGQPFRFLFSGYHKIHFETADRQRFGSEYPATFRFGALDDNLDVQGELAGSFLTRDSDAPELDDPELGSIPLISSLIDPNISSSADAAGMAEATLRFPSSGTRLRSGIQYVGPGYINLAVPALRNDLRELMGGIEQSFYRRQMTISANIRTERHNLNDLKNYTRTSTRYDLQLALNFRDMP